LFEQATIQGELRFGSAVLLGFLEGIVLEVFP
jgi:hypothetical protein